MNYFFIQLGIAEKNAELTNDYQVVMKESLLLYQRISSTLEMLTKIRFHYSLLHSRNSHLSGWIIKTRRQLETLVSLDQDSMKNVLLKLMKMKDLDRRIVDKKRYKDQFLAGLRNLSSLLRKEPVVQGVTTKVTSEWNLLVKDAAGARDDLEELLYRWKDLNSQCEYLQKWLHVLQKNLTAFDDGDDGRSGEIKDMLKQLKYEITDKEEDLHSLMHLKESLIRDDIDGAGISHPVNLLQEKWREMLSMVESRINELIEREKLLQDSHLRNLVKNIQSNLMEVESTMIGDFKTSILSSLDIEKEISNLQVRNLF